MQICRKQTLRGRLAPRRRGFTLVEMLLVLAILATLAAIVVPKFAGRTEQAKITAATTELATIATALDAFEVDNGFYPRGEEGLRDLIEQPTDAASWRGPYLSKEITTDPWGFPYIYEAPGRNNTKTFDLSSMGPDGRDGTEDDITNWSASR